VKCIASHYFLPLRLRALSLALNGAEVVTPPALVLAVLPPIFGFFALPNGGAFLPPNDGFLAAMAYLAFLKTLTDQVSSILSDKLPWLLGFGLRGQLSMLVIGELNVHFLPHLLPTAS
jgi:hypothetical protein